MGGEPVVGSPLLIPGEARRVRNCIRRPERDADGDPIARTDPAALDEDGLTPDERRKVDALAVAKVLETERRLGREPRATSRPNIAPPVPRRPLARAVKRCVSVWVRV